MNMVLIPILSPAAYAAAVVAVVALVTLFTRALPFLFFRAGRPVSGVIVYLGRALPFAIISILVVYCLRGLELSAAPFGAPELIAVALTVALHVWKRNNLISIGVSTAVYMLLVQLVFQ